MRHLLCILALLSAPALAAIDINFASLSQLEAAGFSPGDAQSIINTRKNIVLRNSQDLLNIDGITQGDLNRVRSGITINGRPVTTRSGTAPAIPGVRPAIPDRHNDADRRHRGHHEDGHGKRDRYRNHEYSGKHHKPYRQPDDEYEHNGGNKGHGKGHGHGHDN